MLKAEFVPLVSLKVPSGSNHPTYVCFSSLFAHVSQPLRGDGHEDLFQPDDPVVPGKDPERRAVDEHAHVVRVVQRAEQRRVVVAQRHRGDAGVQVEHGVAVRVHDVVACGLVVVGEELHGLHRLDAVLMD